MVGTSELLDGVHPGVGEPPRRAVADAPDRRHGLGAHGGDPVGAGESGDAAGLGEAGGGLRRELGVADADGARQAGRPSEPTPAATRRAPPDRRCARRRTPRPTRSPRRPRRASPAERPSPAPTPPRRPVDRTAGTRRRGTGGRPRRAACPSAPRTRAPRTTPWRPPAADVSGCRRRPRRRDARRARGGAAPRPRRGTGRGRRGGSTPTARRRVTGSPEAARPAERPQPLSVRPSSSVTTRSQRAFWLRKESLRQLRPGQRTIAPTFRTANALNPASLRRYRRRSRCAARLRRRTTAVVRASAALNGAVMPVPESSGCAGHPLLAHNAAISATIGRVGHPPGFACDHHVEALRGDTDRAGAGRVPRSSPCGCGRRSGTSMSRRATARPRSSRAGFRRRSRSSARTSSGSASAGRRASRGRRAACRLADHSIVDSPSALPRFVAFMVLETPPLPETHRQPVSSSHRSGVTRRPARTCLAGSTQNTLPSGSASTVHVTSGPWPMSTSVAPSAFRRDLLLQRSRRGRMSKCTLFFLASTLASEPSPRAPR